MRIIIEDPTPELIRELMEKFGDKIEVADPARAKREALLAKPPHQLPLPKVRFVTRVQNALANTEEPSHYAGPMKTIKDLCRLDLWQFRKTKNAGAKTVQLVITALADVGLRFEMTDADFEAFLDGRFDPKGS